VKNYSDELAWLLSWPERTMLIEKALTSLSFLQEAYAASHHTSQWPIFCCLSHKKDFHYLFTKHTKMFGVWESYA